jgi:hypothetical protein
MSHGRLTNDLAPPATLVIPSNACQPEQRLSSPATLVSLSNACQPERSRRNMHSAFHFDCAQCDKGAQGDKGAQCDKGIQGDKRTLQ